jgi:hypothetical protein
MIISGKSSFSCTSSTPPAVTLCLGELVEATPCAGICVVTECETAEKEEFGLETLFPFQFTPLLCDVGLAAFGIAINTVMLIPNALDKSTSFSESFPVVVVGGARGRLSG